MSKSKMYCERDNNIKFLQLVKQHPLLYNNNLSEYARRYITDKTWAEIAEQMGCTAAAARDKWKNMRSVYVRGRKTPPPGSTRKRLRPYYLSAYMDFIAPYIKTREEIEYGMSPSPPHSITDNEVLENYETAEEKFAESQPSTSSVGVLALEKRTDTVQEVDSMFREDSGAKKNKVDSSEAPDISNSRRKFVESLLPELDEMPEPKFRLFKREVLRLIDDITINPTSFISVTSNPVAASVTSEDEPSLELIKNEIF